MIGRYAGNGYRILRPGNAFVNSARRPTHCGLPECWLVGCFFGAAAKARSIACTGDRPGLSRLRFRRTASHAIVVVSAAWQRRDFGGALAAAL